MNSETEKYQKTVEPGKYKAWQEVEVEILTYTELGIKVIVEDTYIGLAYNNEIYHKYDTGQIVKAYIKNVREDGKIDVSFQPYQGAQVNLSKDAILEHLEQNGGRSHFNDKSSPEEIRNTFQMSKKVFKQAIGKLYKQGKIKITENGIELV